MILQVELLTFTFLIYPCMAAYYALYRLGKFSFYLLVPGHTPAYSLLAHAMLMCRFGPPLAFNFMAAIAMPASKLSDRETVEDTVSFHHLALPDVYAYLCATTRSLQSLMSLSDSLLAAQKIL